MAVPASNVLVPGMNSQTPALIADKVLSYSASPGIPASGPGGVATFTTAVVAGATVPVSAALEVQSTTGAFIMPRMTAAQRLALIATNGMQVYELDTEAVWWYLNGGWTQVDPTGGGGGDISGPGGSTLNAIVSWNNTLGTTVKDNKAVILVSGLDANASDLTFIATIQASKGADTAGATPNYSFTGDVGTGMWSSGANILDFSTNTVSQFRIAGVAAAVNRILISGSATGVLPANAALIKSSGADAQVDIGLIAHGNTSGVSILPNDGAAVAPLRFWNAAGTFNTSLRAGVNAGNVALTLPITLPASANTPLVGDNAGVLTFSAVDLDNVVQNLGISTDNAIAIFDLATGKLIQNSAAIVSDTTGTITLAPNGQFVAGLGAVGAPSFTFLTDTNTGLYRIATEQIGFTANGELQFAVRDGAGTVVNTAFVQGAQTGAKATIGINVGAGDANQDLALVGRGAAGFGVAIMPTAATGGTLKLYDLAGNNFTALKTIDAQAVDLTYVFPATGPTANQVLSNGADVTSPYQLTWVGNFSVVDVPSSVNFLQETTAITGSPPILSAVGTDPNISMILQSKGGGAFGFEAGTDPQFLITSTASSVNVFDVTGGTVGNGPTLKTVGSDPDVSANFLNKGIGAYTFGNVTNGAQLQIIDSGAPTTGWITIRGSATGAATTPTIGVAGSAIDIDIVIETQGTAGLALANSTVGGTLALLNAGGTAACAITIDPAFVGEHNIQLPNITVPVGGPYVLQATQVDASNTTLSYGLVPSLTLASTTVSLTAAQVQNLVATPVSLVPAAGPGTIIVPLAIVVSYTFVTTPYAATTSKFIVTVGSTIVDTPHLTANGFITLGTSQVAGQAQFITGAPFATAGITNADVFLSNDNVGGEFAAGDGTLKVTTSYQIITL